jgi:hypothetical protein
MTYETYTAKVRGTLLRSFVQDLIENGKADFFSPRYSA